MLVHETIDNGHKNWVVFVHGIAGSTKTWKRQIEAFSKKFNLLFIDLPGHGDNAQCIVDKVDTKRLNKAINELLDRYHILKAHFVGLSMGTIVIAAYAIENRERIKTIVFGGSAMMAGKAYCHLISTANRLKKVLPYTQMYKCLALFLLPKKNHAKSRDIFLREAEKLDKRTMFAWIDYLTTALKDDRIVKELARKHFDIIMISGNEDHCFMDGVYQTQQQIEEVELYVIEGCGHICSIERDEEFNQIALSHLAA